MELLRLLKSRFHLCSWEDLCRYTAEQETKQSAGKSNNAERHAVAHALITSCNWYDEKLSEQIQAHYWRLRGPRGPTYGDLR